MTDAGIIAIIGIIGATLVSGGAVLIRRCKGSEGTEAGGCLLAVGFVVLAIGGALWLAEPRPPSADDLYGCTPRQQTASGECP